jgi:GT2 family glycosyltransferase
MVSAGTEDESTFIKIGIQAIINPFGDDEDCLELFYRCESSTSKIVDRFSPAITKRVYNTYYNSLSIQKWLKYTNIEKVGLQLSLKGDFKISLCSATILPNTSIKETVLSQHRVSTNMREDIYIDYPAIDNGDEILYFSLEAESIDSEFYRGTYMAALPQDTLKDVVLALDICTFRRMEFLENTLKMLQKDILESHDHPLSHNMYVYVVDNDNGRNPLNSLFEHERIRSYQQRDMGSSGGFSKGMLEILNDANERKITHLIVMDDDIFFHPETLTRTYLFLKCLQDEYRHQFIGGAIFDDKKLWFQNGSAGIRNGIRSFWRKPGRDMRLLFNVIDNEKEEETNYNGWWYCCVPIARVKELGLSFPMFMKCDDVEYGLRNNAPVLVLNGICVHHENMVDKYATFTEYYEVRNQIYMFMTSFLAITKKEIISDSFSRVKRNLFSYRYQSVRLIAKALEDSVRGIDWLRREDCERLFLEVFAMNYPFMALSEIASRYRTDNFQVSEPVSERMIQRVIRLITLNGLFLPTNKAVGSSVLPQNPIVYYRAKRILSFNVKHQRGFVTEKSIASFFICVICYLRSLLIFNVRFKSRKEEMLKLAPTLTTEDFWRNYIGRKN